MFTQKRTLIVIGAVVLALGLAAPASAKPELPEGYKLPAAEPACGRRWPCRARR